MRLQYFLSIVLLVALSGCGATPQEAPTSDVEPRGDVSPPVCPDIPVKGCCNGQYLLWCKSGISQEIDCGTPTSCGWNPQIGEYDCGTDGQADPSGMNSLECPGSVQQKEDITSTDSGDTSPPEDIVPEDVTGDVVGDLLADGSPDLLQNPGPCEEIWHCVLENNCALGSSRGDSACLEQCVGQQEGEDVQKFLDLKECTASACATEPSGNAITQCSFQFCTEEWLACVAAEDGSDTCGDMHRCLTKKCGPDYTSPHCISNCLMSGESEADQLLGLMTVCMNSVFFVAAPLECTGGMAACYAGSGDGNKPCGETLMCELSCFQQFCPNPDFCTNFSDLAGCFHNCLWGLDDGELERMYAIQQCMVDLSHNKLVKDQYNIYSYCALQANECLGEQDQFATCSDAYQCLKERYNYFPGVTVAEPQPFWVVVQDCLVDVLHAQREPLSTALWCLHEKYEDNVIDPGVPWTECKDCCP